MSTIVSKLAALVVRAMLDRIRYYSVCQFCFVRHKSK